MPGTANSTNPYLIGAGVGSNILGAILQYKALNKQSQQALAAQNRLYGLADQQNAERQSLTGAILPNLGKTLGIPGLNQLGQQYGQLGANPMPTGSGDAMVPQPGGSTVGKVAGAAGTGVGLAGLAAHGLASAGASVGGLAGPLSFLGGPIGMAIGGGLLGGKLIADQIGKGRRAADTATQNGGYEQQFDQAMTEAVRRRDSGDVQGARQVLQQGYQAFMEGSNAYQAAGGQQQKVAGQALNQNPQKWATYNSIAQSLGVR